MKRFKYYIIAILLIIFNVNYGVSRYLFSEKYPELTQTQLRHNFINILTWNHNKVNK